MEFFAAIPPAYVRETLPLGSYLVSAAPFWNEKKRVFKRPAHIPKRRWFIDCGAYSFPQGLPYSFEEYSSWVAEWNPVFVSLFDRPGDAIWTFKELSRVLPTLSSEIPWVPVVTGKTSEEYKQAYSGTIKLYSEMNRKLERIAIGNLKRRKDIFEILASIKSKIPLHLFGASIRQVTLAIKVGKEIIASSDSGSWNGRFAGGIDEFNSLMKKHSLTQQETAIQFYLPEYILKMEEAAKIPAEKFIQESFDLF